MRGAFTWNSIGAALCLGFAMPGVLPTAWAGVLAVPGMVLWFGTLDGRRPFCTGYLLAAVHLLIASWSLRHVSWAGYLAIAALGGCYGWLPALLGRGAGAFRGAGFALGVALASWLRAHLPEIHYPHGQPVHALYPLPSLLGPLRYGGEFLGNFLLAAVCAQSVLLYRSWRVAEPRWRSAWLALALPVLAWVGACTVDPQPLAASGPQTLKVGVVQPGDREAFRFDRLRFRERFAEMLIEPTRELAATHPDVELVLWPESAWPWVLEPGMQDRAVRLPGWPELPGELRLLVGASLEDGEAPYAVAALLDHRGTLLDWHEKQRPVPAGETIPFGSWLPEGALSQLQAWCQSIVGTPLALRPGRSRAPLHAGADVPVAGLLCFDNAFDAVAREQVDAGARLLCVLSNEAWYLGGAELEQMVALSVCRAIETATPVIRSTVDGVSLLVDAQGQRLPEIPRGDGDPLWEVQEVKLGPGRLGAMAWLQAAAPWLGLAIALLSLAAKRRSVG